MLHGPPEFADHIATEQFMEMMYKLLKKVRTVFFPSPTTGLTLDRDGSTARSSLLSVLLTRIGLASSLAT